MKRLPARLGLSGINYEQPDGSQSFARWTELRACGRRAFPGAAALAGRNDLPRCFRASTERFGGIARRLAIRQFRREIRDGIHLREWKCSRRILPVVFGLCQIAAAIACPIGLFAQRKKSPLVAEVDALMPFWWWLVWIGILAAGFSFIAVWVFLAYRAGIFPYLARSRISSVTSDSNGLTAHLANGGLKSWSWLELGRFDPWLGFQFSGSRRTYLIRPDDEPIFGSLVHAARLETQSRSSRKSLRRHANARHHRRLTTRIVIAFWFATIVGFIACQLLIPRTDPDYKLATICTTGFMILYSSAMIVDFIERRVWRWRSLKPLLAFY
ncbi:MAG TPA: hypothetical protein VMV81_05195 [Phycisphaerae bacterium]|nr:hypothetical protein [Phycisphaerae bacterium]